MIKNSIELIFQSPLLHSKNKGVNKVNSMSNTELSLESSLHTSRSSQVTEIHIDILQPIRQWLDSLPVNEPKLARFLYKAIPGQCPFERDIVILGHKLAHIPPLCKLNPLYDELVGLRFRSLCYLVDECGETI